MMLNGNLIYLRPLLLNDVTDDYIAWMNDYEVTKYTESRFINHTRHSLENFVKNESNTDMYIFAVIIKDQEKHIGNIKIGGVNWHHKYGDIGIIIGKREYYQKGIATECIKIITNYAFIQLGLHKVWCSIYEPNIGSIKAFEKAGWTVFATEDSKFLFEGKYVNCIYMHNINTQDKHI